MSVLKLNCLIGKAVVKKFVVLSFEKNEYLFFELFEYDYNNLSLQIFSNMIFQTYSGYYKKHLVIFSLYIFFIHTTNGPT